MRFLTSGFFHRFKFKPAWATDQWDKMRTDARRESILGTQAQLCCYEISD